MSKEIEEWRDIKGYEGLYQVSDWGRVKSLEKTWKCGNNTVRHQEEKLLSYSVSEKGYLNAKLSKEGKSKHQRVNRLVAEAFIPNHYGYTEVNHKDEDKTNNTVWVNEDGSVDLEKSNLEWCNHKYNSNYGTRNKKISETMTNGKTSKQVYQYSLNGELVKIWSSTNECGRNGFHQGNVSACCNNKFNREGNNIYKNYIWSYTKKEDIN